MQQRSETKVTSHMESYLCLVPRLIVVPVVWSYVYKDSAYEVFTNGSSGWTKILQVGVGYTV